MTSGEILITIIAIYFIGVFTAVVCMAIWDDNLTKREINLAWFSWVFFVILLMIVIFEVPLAVNPLYKLYQYLSKLFSKKKQL